MIKLLKYLIFGEAHTHKWAKEKTIYVYADYSSNKELPIYEKVICKCNICGKYKVFKI